MKIIEKDKKKAEEEKRDNDIAAFEEEERQLTFKTFREDPKMKKYIIDGLIKKELTRITNLEWMYESEHLGSSSNSAIGEMMRRNSVVYRVLKNLLKPITGND